MTNDIIIERPLGDWENFYRCRTALGFYDNFGAVAVYSVDLSKLDALVFRALRKTILDYHVLICNVFRDDETRTSMLKPIARATFGDIYFKVEEPTGDKEWYESFLKHLCCDRLFKIYQHVPLFRLELAGKSTLGVTFEHTAQDGVVASLFHSIFLDNLDHCSNAANATEYEKLYGAAPSEITPETVIFDASSDIQYIRHSLPPPVEMVMEPKDLDYTHGDPDHYALAVPKSHPKKWPGRFPASLKAKKIMKLVNIEPAKFKTILAACKKNGVTFTSYLNCIQALTLNSIYGDEHHSTLMVALTLRRFITVDSVDQPYKLLLTTPNYRMLGNFSHMGLPTKFEPVKDFSWDRVRRVNGELLQTVKNNRLLYTTKPFADAADHYDENEHLFAPILGANKADAVKISNIGACNFPLYHLNGEELTVDDIIFSQDMAPGAGEFVINVVSCPRGGLNLVINYFEMDSEDEFAHELAKLPADLKHNLEKYAGVE